MSVETGVLINDQNEPIYWHIPQGRSAGYLPDSRELWEWFWNNRKTLEGFAHSHPGGGIPSPSWEDLTTFAALEDSLGQRYKWWIASSESLILATWIGPKKHTYMVEVIPSHREPFWVHKLRTLSYEE